MDTNPFTFDRPLLAHQLVDRKPELEQLLSMASSGQSVRLAAPRRYGKTTLINALADAAWEAHEMVPSAGHPQRAMLLAHMLFEQRDDDPDALPNAVDSALREATDGLEQAWRGLSDGKRRVLGALAAGHAELTGKAALAHTGHAKGTQAGLRDALEADTSIARDDRGRWRFVDPFFALWLTQPR